MTILRKRGFCLIFCLVSFMAAGTLSAQEASRERVMELATVK